MKADFCSSGRAPDEKDSRTRCAQSEAAPSADLTGRFAGLEKAAKIAESDEFYGSALQHRIAEAIRTEAAGPHPTAMRQATPEEHEWLTKAVRRAGRLVPHPDTEDAARYRWLVANPFSYSYEAPDKWFVKEHGPHATLADGIDAAMASGENSNA